MSYHGPPILFLATLLLLGCAEEMPPGQLPTLYRHRLDIAYQQVRTDKEHPHYGFEQMWANELAQTVGHKGPRVYPPGSIWILKVSDIIDGGTRLFPGRTRAYFVMRRLDPEDEETYPQETAGWLYEVYPAPKGDPGNEGLEPAPLDDPVKSCHDCHSRVASRGYVYTMFQRW